MIRIPIFLAFAVTAASLLPAQKQPTIAGLNLGEHWFGPKLDLDHLRGKVVLVEIYGS